MSKRDSVVWPLYEKGERRQENAGYSDSPIVRSPRSNVKRQQQRQQHQGEEIPTSPRLEVSNIVDDVPFSQNFSDLFSSLGLHVPPSSAEKRNPSRRRSYEIEDCDDDVRGNDEDWNLDDIEGNIAMSPKRGGFELSTIQEEPSMFGSPVVELSLSDFSFIEDPTEIKPGFRTQIISKDTRLCVKRDNGQKYILRRRRMRSSDAVWSEKTILEMLALANPPRPFIDFIRWSFAHEGYVYLVLDYHPEGTLWDLVAQHGPMGSHRAEFYAAELVSAIASLHAVGIVHRDVDPRNIVLDPQGHLLLTNFGLAKSVLSAGAQLGMMSCTMGFGENMNEYRAPEIFLGWAHDLGVDCWSLGMVVYFMVFGTHPFGGREGIDDPRWLYDRVVVFSVPTESLRLIHPMARDLITKCLQRNPAMRWTIEQIKSHGYFDLVDWDAVAHKRVNAPSFQRTAMEVDRSTLNMQTEPTQHQRRYSSLDNSFSLSYHGHSNNNSHDLSLSRDSETTTNVLRRPPTMMTGLRVLDTTTTTPLSSDIFGSRPLSISITSIVPMPSAIEEEEEPTTTTSASASTGHLSQSRDEPSLSLHPLELDLELEPSMTDFWAEIDREAKHSAAAAAAGSGAASFTSKEFGKGFHVSQSAVARIPKQLRKYRSVVGSSSRLFSLSTASFQRKLRKKPRSDGSLLQLPGGPGGMAAAASSSSAAAAEAEAGSAAQQQHQQQQEQHQKKQKKKEIEPITNLPLGLHQIGSGIGFTYNLPAAEVPSRVSLRSFAPSCQGLFQHVHVPVPGKINRGLGLGLGLGLGVGQQPGGGGGMWMKKGKGKPPSSLGGVGDLNNADLESERSDLDSSSFPVAGMGAGNTVGSSPPPPPPPPATSSNSNAREVGNGTFIRDMYRTPSWILSRPESLPSPLALVNSHSHAERKSSPSSSSSSEPLTPATLVDGVVGVGVGAGDITRAVVVGEEDQGQDQDQDRPGEVNIRIPKHLELDLEWDDFRMWKNGSTLRLVTVPPALAPDAPAPPPPSPPTQVGGKSSREPFSNMNMFLMDGINGMDS